MWQYTTAEAKHWLANSWIARINDPHYRDQVAELDAGSSLCNHITKQWKEWENQEDSFFVMIHGEIIIQAD